MKRERETYWQPMRHHGKVYGCIQTCLPEREDASVFACSCLFMGVFVGYWNGRVSVCVWLNPNHMRMQSLGTRYHT